MLARERKEFRVVQVDGELQLHHIGCPKPEGKIRLVSTNPEEGVTIDVIMRIADYHVFSHDFTLPEDPESKKE